MSFAHLHCHSTYSILDGLPTADKIAARCAELEYPACALTDHASISGAIAFSEKCKKKGIKPILGAEFNITADSATVQDKSNKVGHQVILAKTLEGWYKLVQLVSRSNTPEYFYYRPRIDIDLLKEIGGDNLVSFSGHLGSTLSNIISDEKKSIAYIELMKEIFGRDNFFIEIQVIDTPNYSYYTLLAEKLRDLAIKTNTKTIATGDSHYIGQEDVEDHRLILCSSMKTTFNDIYKRIAKNEDFSLSSFFKSELFGIPTIEQLKTGGNTEEEIRNTNIIADMCEDYDITSPPRLPKYEWTEGMSEVQYLRELCKRGWRKHKQDDWNIQEYGDRVKKELGVIEGANLAGYFLIVQDYVNHFKNNGMLLGIGRGSAAGSLVSYLIGITGIDPIRYNLIFERFFNEARKESMPDIDIDFPTHQRHLILEYLQEKYGKDRVCQIATFGTMQGRGALKEVLRVHKACDAKKMDEITKNIFQEDEINDQLEATGETSILLWMLKYTPEKLQTYCRLNDDGVFIGDYAKYFEQAIRIEGVIRSQGIHAGGIIVSQEPLAKVCPMIRAKDGRIIGGFDKKDIEKAGQVKLDCLGVNAFDKLSSVNNLRLYGKVNP
jgi:DNA polymerase-3 subunit alpha